MYLLYKIVGDFIRRGEIRVAYAEDNHVVTPRSSRKGIVMNCPDIGGFPVEPIAERADSQFIAQEIVARLFCG